MSGWWVFVLLLLMPLNLLIDDRHRVLVSAGCKKCKSQPVIAVETKKVIPVPVPYPVYKKKKCKKKPKTIVVTIPEKKKCYSGCNQPYYYDYYAPPLYYDYYQYVDVPGFGAYPGAGAGAGAGGGSFGGLLKQMKG